VLNRVIALLEQTRLQRLHVSRQYPVLKLATGVIQASGSVKSVFGLRIPVGQAFMQLPHLQHSILNNRGSTAPGGRITVSDPGLRSFGRINPASKPVPDIRK